MKISLLTFFIATCLSLSGFGQDLSGYWEGSITQYEGGIYSNYNFELYLIQNGKKITGRSYVYVDDIYVEFKVHGTIGKELSLVMKDTEILRDRIRENLVWCIKDYQAKLKVDDETLILEGDWQGITKDKVPCIPGKIYLEKIIPRV